MEVTYNADDTIEIYIFDPSTNSEEYLNFDTCNNCYLYMECTELNCKVKNMHSKDGDTLAMYGASPFLADATTIPNC